jgi:hypothetical protein
MAKNPRGRPPKPEGPTPQSEVARAYRARRARRISDQIRDLKSALERRDEEIAHLTKRVAQLEYDLRLEHQHHNNTLKQSITLKMELETLRRAHRVERSP